MDLCYGQTDVIIQSLKLRQTVCKLVDSSIDILNIKDIWECSHEHMLESRGSVSQDSHKNAIQWFLTVFSI